MSGRGLNKWANQNSGRKRSINRAKTGSIKRFCPSAPCTPRRQLLGGASRTIQRSRSSTGGYSGNIVATISSSSNSELANVQRGNINVVVRVRPPMDRERGPARR